MNPIPEQIQIEDIIHSLCLICRGNGHMKYFFSVGQHSVNCCLEAKARKASKRVQLACLLHDAAESYLSDVTRPVKAVLTAYAPAEDRLLDVIWEKYLGTLPDEEERCQVFAIDDAMLAREFRLLMAEPINDEDRYLLAEPDTRKREPEEVMAQFLQLFEELTISLRDKEKTWENLKAFCF